MFLFVPLTGHMDSNWLVYNNDDDEKGPNWSYTINAALMDFKMKPKVEVKAGKEKREIRK